MILSDDDQIFLEEAIAFLENPATFIVLAQKIGKPLARLHEHLPLEAQRQLHSAVDRSLKGILRLAIESVDSDAIALPPGSEDHRQQTGRSRWFHVAAAATSGALGGSFGLATILVELPVSIAIILRSISTMAKQWGHDLKQPEIQLHCLTIFAIASPQDIGSLGRDSAYLSSRFALQGLLREAAMFMSGRTSREILLAMEKHSAPQIFRLLSNIAPALKRSVLQKVTLEALPLLGALGGAGLNAGFCNHYTQAAYYHFGLLRLEEKWGADAVRLAYQSHLELSRTNNVG